MENEMTEQAVREHLLVCWTNYFLYKQKEADLKLVSPRPKAEIDRARSRAKTMATKARLADESLSLLVNKRLYGNQEKTFRTVKSRAW